MIVAVTGGTGFIGKNFVKRLVDRGDTVRLLTRRSTLSDYAPSIEIYECDLLTAGVSEISAMLKGVDVLCHCAGQIKSPLTMRALHVDATRRLVEAASRRVGHWVQLSSVGVYGPVTAGEVVEDSELNPFGEYEITKAESDQIVVEAANNGAFSFSILRPSNVFGAEMLNQSLFGMIAVIARGLFFYIGPPGASANYIHVDNVVEALVRCAEDARARGRVYNLSDHCSMEQFVGTIARALGKRPPRLRLPENLVRFVARQMSRVMSTPLTETRVDALVNRAVYPISRIKNELGYNNVVAMEYGVLQLVEAFKSNVSK